MKECQRSFEHIRKLLITPLVLYMPMTNDNFRPECYTSKTVAGEALFQLLQGQWVLIGYHSKIIPQVVCNFGITKLQLTGLACAQFDFLLTH